MSINGYSCVYKNFKEEIVIERSRFITEVFPVDNEEGARNKIEEIRKLNPFATHNCFAYIVEKGAIARFSDDGEPQGTAGMPILEVIKNKNLVDTLVVVTRYFGGIKLGAGGLVRAYSGSAASAINKAGIRNYVFSEYLKIDFSYDKYAGFLKFKETNKCKIVDQTFAEDVSLTVAVPNEYKDIFRERLTDFMSGKLAISRLKDGFEDYGEDL
ncbi:MAG: YigZ family protein [Clostridia bacterium]|nr:YigZ family protein [Clostridia bacterium]